MHNVNFIKKNIILGLVFSLFVFSSCTQKKKENSEISENETTETVKAPFFKLSLAQWSYHKAFQDGSFYRFRVCNTIIPSSRRSYWRTYI